MRQRVWGMATTDSLETISVLLVEDNPADARLIREIVTGLKQLTIDLDHADSTDEALSLMQERNYALILADLKLPSSSGIDTVDTLLAPDPQRPLIVLTGSENPDIALGALRSGAQDFLIKSEVGPALLERSIRYALERKRAEQALHESEERFRTVVNSLGEGLMITDLDDTVLYVNPAACRITGYSSEEFIGKRAYEVMAPGKAEEFLARNRERYRGKSDRFTHSFQHRGGCERWIEAIASPLRDVDGTIVGTVGAFTDVSDRIRSEQLESGQNQVLEMVVRNEPLETILTEVAQLLEKLIPGAHCAFYLAEAGRLHYRAAPSLPGGFLEATEALPIEATMGSSGAAFHSATSIYCDDVANEALWEGYHHIFEEHHIASLWSVPIQAADSTVLGLFNIHFEQQKVPGGGEEALLASAVRMAAVALEHGKLLGQLTYQAKHDILTGLSNRFDFEEHLGRTTEAARRDDHRLGLLFIDLDRFKHINDTLGHEIGDQLLIQVAKRLRLRTRKRDLLARMGGDEFALLLTDLSEPQAAVRVAQNIVKILEAPFEIDGREMFISASIGVSIFPDDADGPSTLLANVDRAMYQAKAMGMNSFFSFHPNLNEEAFERLELENHLRRALEKDELSLHYQPELDLGSGEVIGFEALLRWTNGVHGPISPAKFIPLAEETGLIIPIGEWVLRQACRQNIAWRRQGNPPVKMAVNVSALQFSQADFYDIVERVLIETDHPPDQLILEVTESVVMYDIDNVARKLERFRDLGIGIALDDFGTGYSSLSYLKRLPVDIIKVDRTFVMDLGEDSTEGRGSTALIQAVVTLAAGLGISALAEGVETDRQLELLRHLGCGLGQGYLFARPRPSDEAWTGIATTAGNATTEPQVDHALG